MMLNLLSTIQMALENIDFHRIASEASRHLTAFEESDHPDALDVEELRQNFQQSLQKMERREYYPRADRFIPQEKKSHQPAQMETPLVVDNVDLNQLMFLLFERVTNLKGLLYQYYTKSEKYDVAADFDLNIEPLLNKISRQEIQSVVQSLLPSELDPASDSLFIQYVDQLATVIHEKKLSGTTHNFLPKKIRQRRNPSDYRNVVRNYIRSMGQHYQRLTRSPLNEKVEQKLEIIRSTIVSLLCAYRINELSHEGIERLNFSEVLTAYADEIALTLGIRVDPVQNDRRLDFEFAPRTVDYIDLGTRYGDCTSRNRSTQVDEVPNIFWTIASYSMDIFHQVQELRIDGDPLMKAHITPCFFRGEPALNIDAFETTLKIRDYKSNRDPIPNPTCDPVLFKRKKEFFDLSLDRIRQLAHAMGIETVICDGYSNTQWARQEIEQYPSNIYHIREYHPLYDASFPRDFAEALLQVSIYMRMEIQALNTDIWDQGLRPNFKTNRTIKGRTFDSKDAIRGI